MLRVSWYCESIKTISQQLLKLHESHRKSVSIRALATPSNYRCHWHTHFPSVCWYLLEVFIQPTAFSGEMEPELHGPAWHVLVGGETRENPCRHGDNMQTTHNKLLCPVWESNPQPAVRKECWTFCRRKPGSPTALEADWRKADHIIVLYVYVIIIKTVHV